MQFEMSDMYEVLSRLSAILTKVEVNRRYTNSYLVVDFMFLLREKDFEGLFIE